MPVNVTVTVIPDNIINTILIIVFKHYGFRIKFFEDLNITVF